MRLRYSLVLLSGVFLLTAASPGLAWGEAGGGAGAADAEKGRALPVRGSSVNAARGGDEGPRLTWRVRRTRSVLAEHFEADHFRMKQGEHFVVFHNTEPQRAATRAALLDLTHQRFHEAFGGFYALQPAEHPLVCVLFGEQEDFDHYARRVDRLDMSWSGGYYSSRTNRMVLFDHSPQASTTESEAGVCTHCQREHPQPDEHEARNGRDAHNAGDNARDAERALLASADEVGAAASPPLNLASTTHEAAHQLAFNTGLQRRGVMYPFWVSEGLACAFETNHPEEPFGLGKPNPTRLDDLRRNMDEGALMPLDAFIAMTRPPRNDRQQLNAVYAQAWALFQFLYLHEREALGEYLRTLAALPAGGRSPATLRREFVDAFGPIETIEQPWHEHLQTLR